MSAYKRTLQFSFIREKSFPFLCQISQEFTRAGRHLSDPDASPCLLKVPLTTTRERRRHQVHINWAAITTTSKAAD